MCTRVIAKENKDHKKGNTGVSFKPVFRTYDDLDSLAGTWL